MEPLSLAWLSIDGAVLGAIVIAAFLPNEVWRWAGLAISAQIDENSEILAWVRAVSTALVAGLVARLIIFPPGALADVAWALRIAAFVAGIAAFYLAGRRMAVGILAAALALLLAQLSV